MTLHEGDAPILDPASAEWISVLTAAGPDREAGLVRLHGLLIRVAVHELHRRAASSAVVGVELDDVAHQCAADAMLAILDKLDTFRGESRFTTWAYKFVVLEVSSKLGRHYWHRHPTTVLETEDWERLPDAFGVDPGEHAERADLVKAVQRAVEETLTDHQRRLFTAIVVNGVPLDAVVSQLGLNRNAVYKAVFDARRKIRVFLVANGYLDERRPGQ
ncbi:RNA polymerase sigma-70 factor (ECF subfamily) [Catenulispora sp. EB89]|uniref:sigma-70 family RNA polymerase sigma factor n=1 Tax=Catenulispora sp. EB89 TaxID=3156257 RepID=UPI003513BC47